MKTVSEENIFNKFENLKKSNGAITNEKVNKVDSREELVFLGGRG